MQRMRKRRKSNLIHIFFMDKSFGGDVQMWLTQREVLFIFNVQKFQTEISNSVCRDLKSEVNGATFTSVVF